MKNGLNRSHVQNVSAGTKRKCIGAISVRTWTNDFFLGASSKRPHPLTTRGNNDLIGKSEE